MSFMTKQPKLPNTSTTAQERASSYREADPVPIGYGCQPYGSHWLSQQYAWVSVPAGQQGKWQYYSIAAGYRISSDTQIYIREAILDENEIYILDYTFAPGETSHKFVLNGALAGGYAMSVTVFLGSATQAFNAALRAGTGQNHPPYRRTITAIWENVVAGINQTSARQLTLSIGVAAPSIGTYTPPAFSWRYGVNAIAAIYGLCRERKGGLGADASVLDEAHWGEQAAALESNGIGQRTGEMTFVHPIFTQGKDAAACLSEALAYVDGYVYFAGGQLKVGWFPNQPVDDDTDLPEITEHDIEEKPSGGGFADWNARATSTVVIFKDCDRKFADTPAKFNAPRKPGVSSAKRVHVDRPLIHTVEQARLMAAEASAEGDAEDSGVTLAVLKSRAVELDGAPLMPGSRTRWDYAPQKINLVCRVIDRRMRVGAASDMLTVIRDRGAFPRPHVPSADPRVPQPDDAPGVIGAGDVRLWQLPSGLADGETRVAALIERGKVSITQATLSMSPTGAAPWSTILLQSFFAAKCTVATTINAAAAVVRVQSTSVDFARMAAQDAVAQADDPLLILFDDGELGSVGAITAVSSNTFDLAILRGRLGTTAASHASTTEVRIFYRDELKSSDHAEFAKIASGGVYNGTVATKYFKVALATKDAEGVAKPDDPGLSLTLANPTPAAITDLVASIGTGKLVELKWSKVDGASEYQVWRSLDTNFAHAVSIGEVADNQFTDPKVTIGTAYSYWVRAVAKSGLPSAASNIQTVTPAAIDAAALDAAIVDAIVEAQATADAAQLDAATALTKLADIASDNLLTADEKPAVILDYSVITSEQAGIDAQAAAYSLSAEKTAYDAAVAALTSYLGGLTTPVLWNDLGGKTTIVGATFRAKFSDVYTTRQTLLNWIYAAAKAAADTAQLAAAGAQSTANTAAFNASAALADISDIVSDNLLTPDEKPRVIQDRDVIVAEQAGIDAAATTFGITTEKTAYDNAVATLTSYLAGLVLPVHWDDLAGNTTIVGATFRANFASVYTARQALLNKIASTANPTAPSDPTAATFQSSGTYLAGDGTVYAQIELNIPALPAGAKTMDVLFRKSGSTGWTLGDQWNVARVEVPRRSTIEDLSPGSSYEFALQARSYAGAVSNIIAATGSPFTAPNKTTGPSAPGAGGLSPDGVPPKFYPGLALFDVGTRAYWTYPGDKDFNYFEIKATFTNSDTATDYTWNPQEGGASPPWRTLEKTLCLYYSPTLIGGYVRVRAVNTSGVASAWTYLGNAQGNHGIGTGDIANLSKSDVAIYALKVGASSASSVRKVVASYVVSPADNVVFGSNTSAVEKFTISLANRGFTTKPDSGPVQCMSNANVKCRYDYDDAGNSSTAAVVELTDTTGANINGPYRLSMNFTQTA